MFLEVLHNHRRRREQYVLRSWIDLEAHVCTWRQLFGSSPRSDREAELTSVAVFITFCFWHVVLVINQTENHSSFYSCQMMVKKNLQPLYSGSSIIWLNIMIKLDCHPWP